MKAKWIRHGTETTVNGHGALRLARWLWMADEKPEDVAFRMSLEHALLDSTAATVTAYLSRWHKVTDAAEVAAAQKGALSESVDMLTEGLAEGGWPFTAAWIRHWAPVIAEIERVPEPEDWTEVEA